MTAEIPYTVEYRIDEGWAGRATRALLRQQLVGSPFFWIAVGLIVLGTVLPLVAGTFTVTSTFAIVVLVLFVIILFFLIRRSIAAQLPVGSTVRLGFGETEFVAETASGSARLRYTAFTKAVRRGEFVLLRQKAVGWAVFTGTAVTDAELARFPSATPVS